jgi:hypothetical protein
VCAPPPPPLAPHYSRCGDIEAFAPEEGKASGGEHFATARFVGC